MLTVPEAARKTRRHPETIRRWIREGKLRARKVGTQHVIDEDDLATLLNDDVLEGFSGLEREIVATIRGQRERH